MESTTVEHKALSEVLLLNQSGTWGDDGDENDFPVLRSSNIKDGRLTLDDVAFRKIPSNKIEEFKLDDGDILVTKSSGSSHLIGKCCLFKNPNGKDFLFSNFTQRLRVDKKIILPEILFYYLNSPRAKEFLQKISNTTSGLRNLHMKDYVKQLIPILPSLEQQKIAATLQQADTARQKRKQANQLTEQFLQSVFLEMFGDPVRNEKGWEVKRGSELFKYSSGKFNPTKNLDESFSFPVYGGNGLTGYSKDFLIDFSTLVIGRVGVYCGSIHKTRGKIWITDNAIFIKDFKQKINLDFAFYLFIFLNFNRFADFSGQPKITQAPLENSNFIIPPLPEQKKFASLVGQTEKLRSKQRESARELENLFQSLMQRYFG